MTTKAEQRRSPRGRYRKQKEHAQRRGIGFTLSFDEWWSIWQNSGKYAQRGRGKGKYCMCRYNDSGAYEVGNVYIDEWTNNVKLQHKTNPHCKDNLISGKKKLSDRKRSIVNFLKDSGVPVQRIACLFNVSNVTVYNIAREKAHLE